MGWNWHKSWNLPDIGVELDVIFYKIYKITDPTTTEKLAPPGKIYVNLLNRTLGKNSSSKTHCKSNENISSFRSWSKGESEDGS